MTAPTVWFAAGDLLPFPLQRAWWDEMVQLVADPAHLDAVLPSLDEAALTTP